MSANDQPGRWSLAWLAYLVTALLSVAAVVWIMDLPGANLRVPFHYSLGGDALFYQMLVKTIADHGWFLMNPNLGAPSVLHLEDFPISDNLPLFIIKLLTLSSSDSGLVLNVYFLLTFPLTAMASLFAFRSCGMSTPMAIAGSLLFSFLPTHFLRGESHLLLATYFQIPLLSLVTVWIVRNEIIRPAGEKNRRWFLSREFAAVGICVMSGACNVYYAFFAAFLFCVAGAIAWFRDGGWRPLITAAALCAIMLASLLVNLAPTFLYADQHGWSEVAERNPGDTEIYGLKLAQLVLPAPGHWLKSFRDVRHRYDSFAPRLLNNENRSSTLGAVAAIGFVLLLAVLFGARPPTTDPVLLADLSRLNLAAVLLGTVGGLSALWSFFVTAQLRAHNRISIFIAFYSLLALGCILDRACNRVPPGLPRRFATWLVAAGVAVLGLLDEAPQAFARPDHARNAAMYNRDTAFAHEIGAALPAQAMVLQLPSLPFPHTPVTHHMVVYDHLRVFLHSGDVRWSFGVLSGRQNDWWHRRLDAGALGPIPQAAATAGFQGIYIDRFGYPDNGVAIVEEVAAFTNASPLESSDKRMVFFPTFQRRQ